jgi:Flp pilus assembly protein CpaB
MGIPAFSLSSLPAGRRFRGRPSFLIRRVLAIALLLTAGVLAVRPVKAESSPSGPAVVSARDIAAGSVLSPADVRLVQVPDSLRPAGALSTLEATEGRLLAGAARSGEPITDARLVNPPANIPGSGDSGKSIVPVRLSESAVASLLHPGERVDVVTASSDGGRQVLASMAVVVTVVPDETGSRYGTAAKDGPLVLLELPSDSATQVAAMSLERAVAVTLR